MNSQNEVAFAEMFCGIGGFRFGLEKTSKISFDSQQRIGNKGGQCESFVEGSDGRQFEEFCCVWANDIDKYACQIYRKHYGDKELVEEDGDVVWMRCAHCFALFKFSRAEFERMEKVDQK